MKTAINNFKKVTGQIFDLKGRKHDKFMRKFKRELTVAACTGFVSGAAATIGGIVVTKIYETLESVRQISETSAASEATEQAAEEPVPEI